MNLIAIVGTNASFSYNRKLLWYMKKHFAQEVEIEVIEIADFPLFSEDSLETPASILEIAQKIEAADGVIFSTPEYDHSITAALKSLIEWLSYGELHPLTNVPVMIVGVSLGRSGTVFAQEHLKQILQAPGLEALVLPGNQFLLGGAESAFNEKSELIDEQTIAFLEECFRHFMIFIENVQPLRWSNDWWKEDTETGASEY